MRTTLRNFCGFGMAAMMMLSTPIFAQQKALYERLGGKPAIDAAAVRNQFLVRIVNKHAAAATFTVTAGQLPAGVTLTGFEAPVTVGPLGEEAVGFAAQLPRLVRGTFCECCCTRPANWLKPGRR